MPSISSDDEEARRHTHSMKNSHFHSDSWTMTAETREPPAAPTGAMAPNRPRPRFRFRPGGKVMPNRATMFGTISPPPIPHRALMKHMETRLVEKPPPRAQRTHHTQPIVKMFLWPKTAPKRPPKASSQLSDSCANSPYMAKKRHTNKDKGALGQRI